MISSEELSANAFKLKLEKLDRGINILERLGVDTPAEKTKWKELNKQRGLLLGTISEQTLSSLKERHPEIARRVEEFQTQQQQQAQQRQRGQDISF